MPPPAAPAPPVATPPPAPAAPQPVTMPAPAVESPSAPDPEKFFSEFDDTPKAEPPTPAATKPDSKPPAKPEKQDPSKAPKPDPKADSKPDAKPEGERFSTPKELRQAYDRANTELKAKNNEVVRLLQELETRKAQGTASPAETAALSERLAKRDQEYQALEAEMKALRYEASPEFKTKYLEPYETAKKKAFGLIQTMVVNEKGDPDPTTGEPRVVQRKATINDFVEIAGLDEGPAWRRARQLFGDDAQLVMRHYERLNEIADQSQTEIARYRREAGEREQAETARQSQERLAIEQMSRKADDGWTKRHKWFGEVEGDSEGNELLKKGLAKVDIDPATLDPVRQVIHRSYVRRAAGAYPRLVHKITAYEARIADLETKLKEFDGSTPGPGTTPLGDKTPSELEEFHKFMQG